MQRVRDALRLIDYVCVGKLEVCFLGVHLAGRATNALLHALTLLFGRH